MCTDSRVQYTPTLTRELKNNYIAMFKRAFASCAHHCHVSTCEDNVNCAQHGFLFLSCFRTCSECQRHPLQSKERFWFGFEDFVFEATLTSMQDFKNTKPFRNCLL